MVRTISALIEDPLLLGASHPLVSVLTGPAGGDADRGLPAFILSNSGIVHRVGPGRLYVKIARRLAARGHVVARIDHGGIGDTDPRPDTQPYAESAVTEMREVMDDIAARRGIERFVILGLCSGADVALETARADERVVGAVMINGGGQSVSAEANIRALNQDWARDYWRRSIFLPGSWWRALTGRIQYRHLAAVLGRRVRDALRPTLDASPTVQSFRAGIAALLDRDVRLLFVYSAGDHALRLQQLLLGDHIDEWGRSGRLRLEIITDTDHTFTFLRNQRDLLAVIDDWADADAAGPQPGAIRRSEDDGIRDLRSRAGDRDVRQSAGTTAR